jgi:hypothetical protein
MFERLGSSGRPCDADATGPRRNLDLPLAALHGVHQRRRAADLAGRATRLQPAENIAGRYFLEVIWSIVDHRKLNRS